MLRVAKKAFTRSAWACVVLSGLAASRASMVDVESVSSPSLCGEGLREPLEITVDGRFDRSVRLHQRLVFVAQLGRSGADEVALDHRRLLAPQRAVVVEGGDPLLRCHGGRALDEVDDRLLVGPSFHRSSAIATLLCYWSAVSRGRGRSRSGGRAPATTCRSQMPISVRSSTRLKWSMTA